MLALGLPLATPRVDLGLESAPGCVLPLGLGRKPGPGPGAVPPGIVGRLGPARHRWCGRGPRSSDHARGAPGDRNGAPM